MLGLLEVGQEPHHFALLAALREFGPYEGSRSEARMTDVLRARIAGLEDPPPPWGEVRALLARYDRDGSVPSGEARLLARRTGVPMSGGRRATAELVGELREMLHVEETGSMSQAVWAAAVGEGRALLAQVDGGGSSVHFNAVMGALGKFGYRNECSESWALAMLRARVAGEPDPLPPLGEIRGVVSRYRHRGEGVSSAAALDLCKRSGVPSRVSRTATTAAMIDVLEGILREHEYEAREVERSAALPDNAAATSATSLAFLDGAAAASAASSASALSDNTTAANAASFMFAGAAAAPSARPRVGFARKSGFSPAPRRALSASASASAAAYASSRGDGASEYDPDDASDSDARPAANTALSHGRAVLAAYRSGANTHWSALSSALDRFGVRDSLSSTERRASMLEALVNGKPLPPLPVARIRGFLAGPAAGNVDALRQLCRDVGVSSTVWRSGGPVELVRVLTQLVDRDKDSSGTGAAPPNVRKRTRSEFGDGEGLPSRSSYDDEFDDGGDGDELQRAGPCSRQTDDNDDDDEDGDDDDVDDEQRNDDDGEAPSAAVGRSESSAKSFAAATAHGGHWQHASAAAVGNGTSPPSRRRRVRVRAS